MKQKDLKESEEKQVMLGTFSMASEGFDCKTLNTIILASPKSNIEQAVGRILRQKKEDRLLVPMVIDIIDNFSIFGRQGEKRLKFYKKNKYNIEDICLDPREKIKEMITMFISSIPIVIVINLLILKFFLIKMYMNYSKSFSQTTSFSSVNGKTSSKKNTYMIEQW